MTALSQPRSLAAHRWRGFVDSLLACNSGVSAVEFGMVLPILATVGMYGVEIANMQITRMQVSQLAISVADNASRMQQTNNSVVAPTISEDDIDSIMKGAESQGEGIKLDQHGRVILSSLEVDPVSGRQFIHWQRCAGGKTTKKSRYGDDGPMNGLNGGAINGLGQGRTKVSASPGVAVMFAEVQFDYEGIFGTLFVENMTFNQEAAFVVRDARDLRASNQPGITGSNGKSKCT